MKIKIAIAALALMLLAPNAFAKEDVLGRLFLRLSPLWQSGSYTLDIRHVGQKILGQTSFGSSNLVNLTFGNGHYRGSAGGEGLTRLDCVLTKCKGSIGGAFTEFDVVIAQTLQGKMTSIQGRMGSTVFTAFVHDEGIDISSHSGNLWLEGFNEAIGNGNLNREPKSLVRAQLKKSGTLSDLDPGIIAIFLVRPFVD
jgi:hypothetical protein